MKATALLAAVGLALSSCSRLEPPTITPISAALVSVSPVGMEARLVLDAHNPNRVDLPTRAVTGKVTLDGKYDIGTVNVPTPMTLAAQKTRRMEVPFTAKWQDLATIAILAASNRDVPYEIDGTVEMGGDALNIKVPFHVKGTLTHAQIVSVALRSVPTIPGIPALPGLLQ